MNVPNIHFTQFRDYALYQLQHETRAEQLLAAAALTGRPPQVHRPERSRASRRAQIRAALKRIRRQADRP